MDHKESIRYKEYLDTISDDELLKMIRKAGGHNPERSERYFLLHNIKEQVYSIKDMEYDLEVLQEEIDKAKSQLKASQEKLKQSFNCR
jgi:uncharacterized small protein (DUF1192 family)